MPPDFTYRGVYHRTPIPSCAISREDLRRLYRDLDVRTREAAERQLGLLRKPDAMTEEEFARSKAEMAAQSGLTVTVLGLQGEQLVGKSERVLDDASLPDGVANVRFESAAAYRAGMGTDPLDRFDLRLDLAEPSVVSQSSLWTEDATNESFLEVIGPTDTWVTAVHEQTLSFLRRRGRNRRWLHTSAAYNWLVSLVGIPLAVWYVYRVDQLAPRAFLRMPQILRGAAYVLWSERDPTGRGESFCTPERVTTCTGA